MNQTLFLAAALPLILLLLANPATNLLLGRTKVHTKGAIIITGASSGIGEHVAATLSTTTDLTVYACARKPEDAERLRSSYPGLRTLLLDVTRQDSIDAAVQSIVDSGLPLIALVNNAGVQADLPIELQTSKADRYNFDVNVFGLLDTTRAFLPLLRRTGAGARIVNTGSLAGVGAAGGSASYSASKFAVEGVTDALRREVAHFGISVSLIQPGYVRSKMGTKAHVASASTYGVTDAEYDLYRHVFEGFFAEDKRLASDEVRNIFLLFFYFLPSPSIINAHISYFFVSLLPVRGFSCHDDDPCHY